MSLATTRTTQLRSPLAEAMLLRPSRGVRKKKMTTALILTSLVDAFSIMLLYLLCNGSGNGSTIELQKTQNLPQSAQFQPLLESSTLVRVADGKYFVTADGAKTETSIEASQLAQTLVAIHRAHYKAGDENKDSLIVQADRSSDFSALTPVIRAGSVSGYHQFKFAVLTDEGGK